MERRSIVQAVIVLGACLGLTIAIYFRDHDAGALIGLLVGAIVGPAIFFARRRKNRL